MTYRTNLLAKAGKKAFGHLLGESWSGGEIIKALSCIGRVLKGSRQEPREIDETPLSVQVEGEASAFGMDTVATADVMGKVVDLERAGVSYAYGKAKYFAAADADDPETPFAATDVNLEIEGADVVFALHRSVNGANFEKDVVTFLAFDFECIDLADSPIEFVAHCERTTSRCIDVDEGNIALAEFDVEAIAEESFVEGFADVLAVDDALSISAVATFAEIG